MAGERERERSIYASTVRRCTLVSLGVKLRKSITPLLLLEFSKNVGKSTSEADILVWRYLFPSMLLPPPEFRKFGVRTDDVPPPPPNALVVPHEFNVVRIRRTTSPAAKMSHSFPDTATSPPTGMGNISAIRLGEMEFRVDEEQRRGVISTISKRGAAVERWKMVSKGKKRGRRARRGSSRDKCLE